MSVEVYVAYALACLFITIVPGPTVTGAFFSRSRIRLVSRLSGGFLIGGIWLALTRAK